ncbi:MAG: RNA methyltransferase [Beijerinckiaceae bacterium]
MKSPVIILVRPQMGQNIGMAARAMANFGLFELRLVAPRDGWGEDSAVFQAAVDSAVGAHPTVRQAKLFDTAADAIADLNRVFATTARERDQAKPVVSAEGFAQEAKARGEADQRVGILFGPERTGMTNDEIALADAIVSFAVNPEHSSLNLAQSVSLVAYEWFKALEGGVAPFALQHVSPPAKRETMQSFFSYLEEELDKADYFIPQSKRSIMSRNLRNIYHRMELTEADLRTLRGVTVILVNGRRRPVKGGGESDT